MTVQAQPAGLVYAGCPFWADADCKVTKCVKEGSIAENVGPGKAKVRYGDYPPIESSRRVSPRIAGASKGRTCQLGPPARSPRLQYGLG